MCVVVDMVTVVLVGQRCDPLEAGLWKAEVVDGHDGDGVVVDPCLEVAEIGSQRLLDRVKARLEPEVAERFGNRRREVGRNDDVSVGIGDPGEPVPERGFPGAVVRVRHIGGVAVDEESIPPVPDRERERSKTEG